MKAFSLIKIIGITVLGLGVLTSWEKHMDKRITADGAEGSVKLSPVPANSLNNMEVDFSAGSRMMPIHCHFLMAGETSIEADESK